jgi:hypothetical protein
VNQVADQYQPPAAQDDWLARIQEAVPQDRSPSSAPPYGMAEPTPAGPEVPTRPPAVPGRPSPLIPEMALAAEKEAAVRQAAAAVQQAAAAAGQFAGAPEGRARKRFGPVEIGLLAIIVVIVCCMVVGLLWVVGQSRPAVNRPTPTPMPGWEQFEGGGAVLWLPDRYAGGDLGKNAKAIANELRRLGPEYEEMAKIIENNSSAFVIWAYDSRLSDSGFLTNVNVVKEDVFFMVTLDGYVDSASSKLPSSFKIIAREKVALDRYEAIRLTVEMNIQSVYVKELVYMIKDGNTIWAITYATGKADFQEQLRMFELSANSFWVK